ncbi:zinc-dependent dehydrogenase [Nonomuraea monospora]|uniref:Zinc-dependent dehydrogenase n=1 Tax=Nonomuraea monospora TaxID=568818 RepID=A0ABN3C6V6_9ACTN
MLALRARSSGAEPRLERIPVPQPGPDDVLVEVRSAGLAPGVLGLLKLGRFRHLPSTLGHEAAGVVTRVGAGVTGFGAGDRVRIHPNLTCRACVHCRTDREQMCPEQAMIGHAGFGSGPMPLYERYHDGGLAEYVRAPAWLVDRLPDGVGFDVAAKVPDLANAVRALRTAAPLHTGTVVVTAATGCMGSATVRLAHLFGVTRLILLGRSRERLRSVAALASVPVETVALDETGGLTRRLRRLVPGGADAVIDYLPDQARLWEVVSGALGVGGTLVHMGTDPAPHPVSFAAMMANCWRFTGLRGSARGDAHRVLALLGAGVLTADELITHRFPLERVDAAISAMRGREHPMWMTVVHPPSAQSLEKQGPSKV